MSMEGGYPAEADIDSFLAERGIELITENNTDFGLEFKQLIYRLLNDADWPAALAVYCPTPTTFNVRGGKYLWKNTVKTFETDDAVDPTDNDTTYIWLTADNEIDSDIDGTGWPTTEHIKLAEIDVDGDGIITDVRDLRGQTFLHYAGKYKKKLTLPVATGGGTSDITAITGAPSINLNADGETFYASFPVPNDWDGESDLTLYAAVQNEIAETDGDDVSISCTVHGVADGETNANAGQAVELVANLTGGDEAINKVNQVSAAIDYNHGTYPLAAGDTVIIKGSVNLGGAGECTGPLHIVSWWVEYTANKLGTAV